MEVTVRAAYSSTFQLSVMFVCFCALQNTADFSLVKSDNGEIVTEDGRSRCPFNPEYKSTAIMAGRSQNDSRYNPALWCMFCFIEATVGISKVTTGGWYGDKLGHNL